MADLNLYVAVKPTTASAAAAIGATSMTVAAVQDRLGNTLTMADFGTKGRGVISPGKDKEEQFTFTGISSTTISGISWVTMKSPYTETSGFAKAHAAGEKVILSTNGPEFYDTFLNKANDETITGTVTFTSTAIPIYSSVPTITDDKHLIHKKYADDLAIAGAPDASTTAKGIVEEATDAELQAGTAAGGTSARLFAGGASHTQTATANKVPVGKSSGKLDDGWLGLTTAGDTVYSDGTDLQRLAKGTTGLFLEAGASAPTWGGANLAEANTFFGATDISGAEAETLTAGTASDADTLHIHKTVRSMVDYSVTTGSGVTKTVTIPANTLKTGGMIKAIFVFNYVSNNLGVTLDGTSLGTFNSDGVYEITIIQTSTGNQTASKYLQGVTDIPTQTALTKDTTTALDLAFAVGASGAIYSLTVEVIHSI